MKQLKLPIEWIDCRHYQNCDAPLCPQDVNVKQCIWFPGEPVCRLKTAPEWVAKQRQIKRLKNIDRERYFTVRILERIKEITPQTQGADPELTAAEKAWLAPNTRASKTGKSSGPKKKNQPSEPGNYMLF